MAFSDAAHITRSLERLNDAEDRTDVEAVRMLNNDDNLPGKGHHDEGKYYLPVRVVSQSVAEDSVKDVVSGDPNATSGRSPNTLCGIGPCTPAWAQKLANLPLFAVIYGVAGIWMTTLSSLLASQITSIERHLGLSTTNTGMILSANDVGYLVAVMIGSHVGKYLHIPRTLSVSAIVFGCSCAVMALGRLSDVHATKAVMGQNSNSSKAGTTNQQLQYLCKIPDNLPEVNMTSWDAFAMNVSTPTESPTPRSTTGIPGLGLSWAFWLMLLSAACGGMVKSYRLPLFTYYLERNVKDASRSAFLLGTSFTTMVFGPPIAMLLGAYTSSLYVDLKDSDMSQYDQRWVGAWWLGFLIVGVACIVSALPVMCFPRQLTHGRNCDQAAEEAKTAQRPQKKIIAAAKQILADLPQSLRRIFRRPVYILMLVSGTLDAFIIAGTMGFLQKYIETQFNKTPQEVSISLGILIIFTLATGTFLGGVLVTRLKLGLRGCVIAMVLRSISLMSIQCLYFVFGCGNVHFADNSAEAEVCHCDEESILIVCGDNQMNYLSPCLAGCTNGSQNLFSNCSAIQDGGQQARPGLCDDGCPFFEYFISTYCFLTFLSCMGIIPGYMAVIRSVNPTDQALALGTGAFWQTLLGTLPAPVLVGKVIDSTCQIWSPGRGYCLLYDRDAFRVRFLGLNQAIRVVDILVMLVLVWLVVARKIGSGVITANRNKKNRRENE
ncbi:solute carrier organic anion transporter family member [Plakobranchus ocellatus]|uniref:Solute carrier organic anion transporter family member n=1 Tax=Plakobranchus ocellatus TaxID=259542 RepID=A0AAV4DY49_9GAST|nr:solute carrier organic anion transporter family member [Plakobranchus ocellatus]